MLFSFILYTKGEIEPLLFKLINVKKLSQGTDQNRKYFLLNNKTFRASRIKINYFFITISVEHLEDLLELINIENVTEYIKTPILCDASNKTSYTTDINVEKLGEINKKMPKDIIVKMLYKSSITTLLKGGKFKKLHITKKGDTTYKEKNSMLQISYKQLLDLSFENTITKQSIYIKYFVKRVGFKVKLSTSTVPTSSYVSKDYSLYFPDFTNVASVSLNHAERVIASMQECENCFLGHLILPQNFKEIIN